MELLGTFVPDLSDTFYDNRQRDTIYVAANADKFETVRLWLNNDAQKTARIKKYYEESFTIEIDNFYIHAETKSGTYLIDKETGTEFITI